MKAEEAGTSKDSMDAVSNPTNHSTSLVPGDHAYVSPPHSARDGEPYLVTRIIELYDPTDSEPAQVRVAYYFRMRDVTSRLITDSRNVIATMHSDKIPQSFIRGPCRVLHRDQIGDLDAYKSQPDSFWYNTLYDRYLHRWYDVIPTSNIRNAPDPVLASLSERFEFVFAEIGLANDLCDSMRGCAICHKWTSSFDSVKCALCQQSFHLQCVDPPLSKRPALGYSWACAPCSKKRDEDLDNGVSQYAKFNQRSVMGRTKDPPERRLAKEGKPMRMTDGWPFRYFGVHIDAEDVLDPHDSLYARAATRLGPRYQTNIPEYEESPTKETKEQHGRGGDDNVELVYRPSDDPEKHEDKFMDLISGNPHGHKTDYIAKVLAKASANNRPLDPQADSEALSMLKIDDVGEAVWTADEKKILEEYIRENEDELDEVVPMLAPHPMSDIVKYYYLNHGFKHQDKQQLMDQYGAKANISLAASTATDGQQHGGARSDEDDDKNDDSSIIGDPPSSRTKYTCAVCGTYSASSKNGNSPVSTIWYHCPDNIGEDKKLDKRRKGQQKAMCEDCGIRWRHYGIQYARASDPNKTKQNDKVKKRKYVRKNSDKPKDRQTTPQTPPKIVLPPKPCHLCNNMEPATSLAQCQNCTVSVHASCFGIPEDIDLEDWKCDLCEAYSGKRLNIQLPHCVLCPEIPPSEENQNASTALDLMTETEYKKFVHYLCSIFHPETTFTIPNLVRGVEGISSIPPSKWQKTCVICEKSTTGACVKCRDCPKHFHVSCAWSSGFKFAFEIQPLKKKKAALFAPMRFQNDEGEMTASIWCKDHKIASERATFDIAQKDSAINLTALQMFVRHFKSPRPDSIPILRKSQRIEPLIKSAISAGKFVPPPPEPLRVVKLKGTGSTRGRRKSSGATSRTASAESTDEKESSTKKQKTTSSPLTIRIDPSASSNENTSNNVKAKSTSPSSNGETLPSGATSTTNTSEKDSTNPSLKFTLKLSKRPKSEGEDERDDSTTESPPKKPRVSRGNEVGSIQKNGKADRKKPANNTSDNRVEITNGTKRKSTTADNKDDHAITTNHEDKESNDMTTDGDKKQPIKLKLVVDSTSKKSSSSTPRESGDTPQKQKEATSTVNIQSEDKSSIVSEKRESSRRPKSSDKNIMEGNSGKFSSKNTRDGKHTPPSEAKRVVTDHPTESPPKKLSLKLGRPSEEVSQTEKPAANKSTPKMTAKTSTSNTKSSSNSAKPPSQKTNTSPKPKPFQKYFPPEIEYEIPVPLPEAVKAEDAPNHIEASSTEVDNTTSKRGIKRTHSETASANITETSPPVTASKPAEKSSQSVVDPAILTASLPPMKEVTAPTLAAPAPMLSPSIEDTNKAILTNSADPTRATSTSSATATDQPPAKKKKPGRNKPRRDPNTACANCGITYSPLWRRDDQGRTVCNSCGLYAKTHGTNKRPPELAQRALGTTRIRLKEERALGIAPQRNERKGQPGRRPGRPPQQTLQISENENGDEGAYQDDRQYDFVVHPDPHGTYHLPHQGDVSLMDDDPWCNSDPGMMSIGDLTGTSDYGAFDPSLLQPHTGDDSVDFNLQQGDLNQEFALDPSLAIDPAFVGDDAPLNENLDDFQGGPSHWMSDNNTTSTY